MNTMMITIQAPRDKVGTQLFGFNEESEIW